MGGYAAIRFASAVGADTAIALSPQYGLGWPAAPFETRFRREGPKHVRGAPGPWHRSDAVTPYVFFDPHDLDALHERRIRRFYPRTRSIPLPRSGHATGIVLQESGLLQPAAGDGPRDGACTPSPGSSAPVICEPRSRWSNRRSGWAIPASCGPIWRSCSR